MYNVSEEYKQAIYAPIRQTKARVNFDFSDTTISQDLNTVSTSNQFAISAKYQLINRVRETTNLATLEPNRFSLDGSFSFADDVLENNGEVGFCSDILCMENSSFEDSITIEITFNTSNHSSAGFTVSFDTNNNEYATDFILNLYDASTLLKSIVITDNDEVQPILNEPVSGYKRAELIINKWSKGNRRARVSELDFGFYKVYTNDNLIKLNFIEQLDIIGGQLPCTELSFTFDNSKKEFNILNPNGFYKYLQERQRVNAEIGVVIEGTVEYVPLMELLLLDWTSDEGGLTATFTARTILDIMNNYEYENLNAKINYNLYLLAQDIFSICGITNYLIDTSLQNISTRALTEKMDCKTVLQMIAIAGCANVYVTRDNIIHIKSVSLATNEDSIDMDNMYQEPQIKLDKIVKTVEVAYFDTLENSTIVVVSNNITEGDVLKIDNTLINTITQATNVANWVIAQKNNRAIYTVNWRGNPVHELGDNVLIENSYGISKNTIVTKTELEYAGCLSGKTELRGVVQ